MTTLSHLLLLLAFPLLAYTGKPGTDLKTETPPIIPMPAEIEYMKGSLRLKDCQIRTPTPQLEELVQLLKDGLKKNYRIRLQEKTSGNLVLDLDKKYDLPEEGYHLTVSEEGIRLEARSETGLFYGIQTLIQMPEKKGKVRFCEITDYPAFPYRGLHLDVSRHFMSIDYIKKQLDLMARYKFNRFHWHLTDGGGWRFESKNYPLLTQKGQARMGTDWREWRDKGEIFVETGTPGSYGGFYTQEELKEIVDYAAKRYITVIPEIEMPGHSNEVFYAYPELTCKGKPGSWEFCMGNPDVFTFLHKILDEIMAIFPSPYIHIGGDEARKKDWKTCPECQALMKEKGLKDVDELQSWCIHSVEEYLNSKGRNIIGWDEILQGGLAPNATVMSWRGEKGGKTAAKMGHPVIMTPGNPLYFDHYQGDPMTEPHAIGGYNPLEKVYAYNPRPADLTEEENRYILGAQANLWTEYVNDESHAEYMTWPRALALAEVVWTPAEKKDFDNFLLRANLHTQAMRKKGINAFPLKNVTIKSEIDTIKQIVRVFFQKENMLSVVRYTTDGSKPNWKSPAYTDPIEVKDSIKLTYQSYIGKKALTSPGTYSIGYHKAIGKKVTYHCTVNRAYPAQGEKTLTDGTRGTWSYSDQLWQGFTSPLDITIDLGEVQPLHSVSANFIQVKTSGVYIPYEVEVLVSVDGEHFQSIGKKKAQTQPEKTGTCFEDITLHTTCEARFVQFKAIQGKKGGFIFTDEIRIY